MERNINLSERASVFRDEMGGRQCSNALAQEFNNTIRYAMKNFNFIFAFVFRQIFAL